MNARPPKTLADYFAIAISPVLIMLLVGSLCYFLVEVFYRGEAADSVRWVLFWYVLATVLVTRIGIEQGVAHAMVYGLALAAATWLYLTRIHPAWLLGALMLGIIWWCTHKLTWDCTLIDEEADASGTGLLQFVFRKKNRAATEGERPGTPEPKTAKAARPAPRRLSALHSPGVWLIYFSLAALPLFGIGQTLLAAGDWGARQKGFDYLFVYLCALLGLFLTTSFLGLRRYLRQRLLPMPASIAWGWAKLGVGMAALVLLLALLLPRPGAGTAWATLRYHIDYQLRRASEYALRINPPGTGGQNKPGNGSNAQKPSGSGPQGQTPQSNGEKKSPAKTGPEQGGGNQSTSPAQSPPPLSGAATALYHWLKALLLLACAIVACWWIYSRRELLLQMVREAWAAIMQFFRDLFNFRISGPAAKVQKSAKPQTFASYRNPFASGESEAWTAQQLIVYTYEALQSWAAQQGLKLGPEETAREFCRNLGGQCPEVSSQLNQLAILYGHAAYGTSIPGAYRPEPLKILWEFIATQRFQTANEEPRGTVPG